MKGRTIHYTIGNYLVDLYTREPDGIVGFEVTTPTTTNVSGYFRTGSLHIVDKKLVDYDGVFELPTCVCEALKGERIDVSYADA
jgi:hypothetical protein